MKYDAGNTALRYAIWVAYGRKCKYTHEPIKYHEMEIDHFIPKDMANKPEELRELLKEAGIELSFDILSIENCLPAKAPVNNSKSNIPFDAHNTRYYLNHIKEHLDAIESIYKEFGNCEKNAKAMAQLQKAIEKGNEELEEIVNNLTGDASKFELCDDESDYYEWHAIKKNYERVGISMYLPSKKNIFGSCSIYFKSLAVRECYITFDHQDITSILFSGIKTDPEDCSRGFIDHKLPNEDMFCIQYRQLRFYLKKDDTLQLCRLIDEIYPKYLNKLRELDKFHGIRNFTLSKEGKVRLLKVSRTLYKMILDFGSDHDYLSGNSEWHIFNSSLYNIMAMNRVLGNRHSDFHTILYPATAEHILGPLYDSNEVWIEWPLDNRELVREKYEYSEVGYWNATMIYKWLTESVIPKVVYENIKKRNNKKSLLAKTVSFQDFIYDFNVDNYVATKNVDNIDLDKEWNVKDIVSAVQKLQSHFTMLKCAWFSKDEIVQVYLVFAEVINCCRRPLTGYAIGHLSYIENINYDPIKAIKYYADNIGNQKFSCGRLDTFFRSYLDVLREIRVIDSSAVEKVKSSLLPFIDNYSDSLLLKKYIGKL